MRQLDACPLCRAALQGSENRCPDCGADLTLFADINNLAERYLEFCRELIARGDVRTARSVIDRLPQISNAAQEDIAGLQVRLALQEGDYLAARRWLAQCSAGSAAGFKAEIDRNERGQFRARELYNQSLAAARRGAGPHAAEQLAHAVTLDPDDPRIWTLKLKVDLKYGYFQRCYADLTELDRLVARPPEFHYLEQLLPPVQGG